MNILKINFLLLFLAIGLLANGQSQKYIIRGKVPELSNGNMLLITRTIKGLDTIARAPIQNGEFLMEGTIKEPIAALIAVEKFAGGFIFLLDTDAPYTMELHANGDSNIQGGKLQTTLGEYMKIVNQANSEMKTLKGLIEEATAARHFKTKKELEDKLKNYLNTTTQKLEAIVHENKDNLFAAHIQTSGLEQVVELDVLKERYARLSDGAQKTPPAMILAAKIADLEKVNVSATAPDFTLTTPDGKTVSLYDVKGKIKIIDFWASWCGPCRMENPNMVKLYADFKDKGLTVISVSLDEKKEKWTEAIAKDGMPWLHLSSLEGWKSEVVKQYGIDAVPTIFVLDENNRILAKQLRGNKLHAFIESYLK